MGHRRYFIRKDAKKAGKAKEWIEMEGDEFYRFLHTKEAKGRYFIQLTNDGDTDCDVIHMEVSKPESRKHSMCLTVPIDGQSPDRNSVIIHARRSGKGS